MTTDSLYAGSMRKLSKALDEATTDELKEVVLLLCGDDNQTNLRLISFHEEASRVVVAAAIATLYTELQTRPDFNPLSP